MLVSFCTISGTGASERSHDLRHGAAALLEQRQKDMFGVDLGVLVLLQDFVGAHGGFLRFFGKVGQIASYSHFPPPLAAG
jgi:hypothetical protein